MNACRPDLHYSLLMGTGNSPTEFKVKYKSELDKNFAPVITGLNEFLLSADRGVGLAVEDAEGFNFRFDLRAGADAERNYFFAERAVKSLLWIVGGRRVYVAGAGADGIAARLAKEYARGGARAFDADFMEKVYGRPFEVVACRELPPEKRRSVRAGGKAAGCRIGFDAGGSDRKVSAVIDGQVVFSEEVVWHPKLNADPDYHFRGIVSALKTAAAKLPRVDSIGVSSAGIYINNRTRVASLFLKVPEEKYHLARDIYIRAAREIGAGIPLTVANDGDVTAVAGGMSFNSDRVLGIAMGTSEAGGYLNAQGGLNGWLSELAFVPCDLNPDGAVDEWSGDKGTGVKYFSQDAVIKLCPAAGIPLDGQLSPAEKLKAVQELMKNGDPRAREIYRQIGVYLGYTLPFYALFYDIKYALVLGRVLSGAGGDLIVSTAEEILRGEFPELTMKIVTPDEKFKRVGQSIAASSL
ncbi:MAG: ROK family protein [Clostridiales bacterium]|nr:ROK family protein [Clostridiales bacterium]